MEKEALLEHPEDGVSVSGREAPHRSLTSGRFSSRSSWSQFTFSGFVRIFTIFALCHMVAKSCSYYLCQRKDSQGALRSGPTPVSSRNFRWGDIEPSRSLSYVPCFDGFQCARLSVPMNWNATAEEQDVGPRAALAVIKLPAQVPVTDKCYGGPIIFNPGGPGVSGVDQVLNDGRNLQIVVDAARGESGALAEDGKYFDVLSFDPRGVNNTTPALQCFPDVSSQRSYSLQVSDYGLLWDAESVIGLEWAKAAALGMSCESGDGEEGILRYVNTAQTAEDVLHLTEMEGQWRADEARRLLAEPNRCHARAGGILGREGAAAEEIEQILVRTAYVAGQEKTQYWGSSYGTLLGSTVAALHPDRIGRMIIDGVVDPADHYAGNYLTQLQDSNKIVTRLCDYCFRAGPDRCPLWLSSSAAAIEVRFTTIMTSVKMDPIPVKVPGSGPELVSFNDAHLSLLMGMYFSFAGAEALFALLRAIENRDTSAPEIARVVAFKRAILSPPPTYCGSEGGLEPCDTDPAYNSLLGPFQAVSCMDIGGPPAAALTRNEFREYLAVLHEQGRWIAPSWARHRLACQGFAAQPVWRPDWTFVTSEWAATAHPLLVIGNAADTVTPLGNARRVARDLFPGAVVLQQDSEGHCSGSVPSLCTGLAVREYFQTGKLPAEGTVCPVEVKPFVGCIAEEGDGAGGCKWTDKEHERLWEAMAEVAGEWGDKKGNATVEETFSGAVVGMEKMLRRVNGLW